MLKLNVLLFFLFCVLQTLMFIKSTGTADILFDVPICSFLIFPLVSFQLLINQKKNILIVMTSETNGRLVNIANLADGDTMGSKCILSW